MPRLRVFAGPNGSGKSTIKTDLPAELTRIFVNADELEKEASTTGFIDLAAFGLTTTPAELLAAPSLNTGMRISPTGSSILTWTK